MSELPNYKITELNTAGGIDKDKDYLLISKYSTAYTNDYESLKVTPDTLVNGVGAKNIRYDNSKSKLPFTNLQDVIDFLAQDSGGLIVDEINIHTTTYETP